MGYMALLYMGHISVLCFVDVHMCMSLCFVVVWLCYLVTFQIACKPFDGSAKTLCLFEFFLEVSNNSSCLLSTD